MKPEQYVLNSIMEWLAVKKIWAKRMNTGALKVDKRFIRFGTPGMADVMATPRLQSCGIKLPVILWIECKAPKGVQSAAQKAFEAEVTAEGHLYCLARSIDDVAAFIEANS